MKRFTVALLALLLTAPTLAAAPDTVEVHLTDRRMFTATVDAPSDHDPMTPYELDIKAGTTVEWYVEQGHHLIVADDNSFSSGALTPGMTYSHRFDRPGLYRFHNDFHLGGPYKALRGVIRVRV